MSALDSTEVGASAVSSVTDSPTPEVSMDFACCSVTFPARSVRCVALKKR